MSLKSRLKENQTEGDVKEDVKKSLSEEETEKMSDTYETPERIAFSKGEKDYPKKIDKVYAQMKTGDVFLEVLEDGFNLTDEDKGYNTKIHINFSRLDKSMKQKAFKSHYLDLTNFLYLRNIFLSGKYSVLEELERATLNATKKYCESIFSEYKQPDKSISNTFYVTPGMKQGNWMIGIVEVNSKTKENQRIQVPVTTARLIAMLELIYLAYQKHLFRN